MSVESALDHLRDGSDAAVAHAIADLKAAAKAGAPEASRYLATLAAAGVGMPQSWARAMSNLFAAALAGSDSARGQLTVLAPNAPPPGPHETDPAHWRRLCASVHVEDWLKPCDKRDLGDDPRMVAIEGFLTPPICDWLVRRTLTRTPAAALDFDIVDSDVVLQLTRQKIAAAVGAPVGVLDTPRMYRFGGGDITFPATPPAALTFLVYLTDGFAPGDAAFEGLGPGHRARLGDAVYVGSLESTGGPAPHAIHADLARSSGNQDEKWVLSQTVRDRA